MDCSFLPVWEGRVEDCEEHSLLSSYPPSWSQEPQIPSCVSQDIPFAREVSEFSKPEPWACTNRSLPLPPEPPATLPYPTALELVPHRISSPLSGLLDPSKRDLAWVNGSDGSASPSGLQLREARQSDRRKGFLRLFSGPSTPPPQFRPCLLGVPLHELFFQVLALRNGADSDCQSSGSRVQKKSVLGP
ncbi:hypothetical protein PAL_GLEAN10012941 [Pteropus alecto]|uniref:Uncharacterized protein n=1 Tax=Pteropus alecto TaxID=9402 RepID=L5KI97_PTEAL|nr:hypothetical protein PAL_GLEAN10012941 [Pteropus alecto]